MGGLPPAGKKKDFVNRETVEAWLPATMNAHLETVDINITLSKPPSEVFSELWIEIEEDGHVCSVHQPQERDKQKAIMFSYTLMITDKCDMDMVLVFVKKLDGIVLLKDETEMHDVRIVGLNSSWGVLCENVNGILPSIHFQPIYDGILVVSVVH
eukprot:c23947_g1_i2 orf=1-462(-)